ncbi:MAG TPA: MobQ family relaxase [Steroidobacteraceae bacterium]|jgi:hypothetical protein
MATFFLRSKHISRGTGARVTRAAAYRAGERIRDERTGDIYDFSGRQGVAHQEIVLPSQLAGHAQVDWARDRSTLWNAAERVGQRRDSRLARELLVFLPVELTPTERIHLVRSFSQELADQYGSAVDYAIHEPRPGADLRHHHAHVLMTTREITPEGLGPRTTFELGGRERHLRGLGPSKEDYLHIRERWAQMTNDALRHAGLAARVDHRSYKDQGINREPAPTIPGKVFYAEQRSGAPTPAGEAIRARYRERVEARAKGGEELERVLQRQKQELRQRASEALKREASQRKQVPWGALTREERNQRRREQYRTNKLLALRQVAVPGAGKLTSTAEEAIQNWKAYRATHGPGPTSAQSVRSWQALSQTRNQAPEAKAPTNQHRQLPQTPLKTGADAHQSEENGRNKHRHRSLGPDLGL